MTFASFNARLRILNPHLRVRKRTGWRLLKSEGFAMACVFWRYQGHPLASSIDGPIPYRSRPTLYRAERLPGKTEPLLYIHSRPRRGRWEMINLLKGHRGMKHRYEQQFMKI